MKRHLLARIAWPSCAGLLLVGGCSFDRGDRWLRIVEPAPVPECEIGQRRCGPEGIETCTEDGTDPAWQPSEPCPEDRPICAPTLLECVECLPGARRCDDAAAQTCRQDGHGFVTETVCDAALGNVCRDGGCLNLCTIAQDRRSNVGCEYWAADLDNANIDESLNAAAQQFAVVVSNPQSDIAAEVVIERDDTAPGAAGAPVEVARATVLPLNLQVFRLGPREVDGSGPGEFNTGTHSALTRAAFRITTSVPVVAYQFNPLENVNVFSNDASLLKPVEALESGRGDLLPAYVVLGWPQTIATTNDPDTNFSQNNPIDLRTFVTVVGTRPNTHVRLTTRARVIAGDGIPGTDVGETVDVSLDPFDVANFESDDFNADFTGSLIEADQPIVVFSGGEASDAPFFDRLADRECCADHLEEQLDPLRTAGKRFLAAVSPNRSRAVTEAGGDVGLVETPDYFRVIAATAEGALVRTSLDGEHAEFELDTLGSFEQLASTRDFLLESDAPVMLGSVSPSQDAAGIPSGYPGGDPSFLVIPPIEQFRRDYVFLTPDKYSFDFIRFLVPDDTEIRLDDRDVSDYDCESAPLPAFGDSGTRLTVYRCQLSFPVIDPSLDAATFLSPGRQNDGVHAVVASRPIGVLVDGFDRNVSYAYAAGTELTQIVIR